MDNNINEPQTYEASKETIKILKEHITKLSEKQDEIQAENIKLESEIITTREEFKIRELEWEKKLNTCNLQLQAMQNMIPDLKAYKDSGQGNSPLPPLESVVSEE